MYNNDIILMLGMKEARMKNSTIAELCRQYKGLYWFVKQITTEFEYSFNTVIERLERINLCYYRITIQYDNGRGSASFDLPNHYITDSHINAFNSAIIGMLQAGIKKSICLPSKAAAHATNL